MPTSTSTSPRISPAIVARTNAIVSALRSRGIEATAGWCWSLGLATVDVPTPGSYYPRRTILCEVREDGVSESADARGLYRNGRPGPMIRALDAALAEVAS